MNYSAINKRLIALCNWSKFANFAKKRKGKIMIEIRLTKNGYETSHKIGKAIFAPNGNAVVRVICEHKCNYSVEELEDAICRYMSSLMPDDIEVKTHHVTLSSSTSEDTTGKYVNMIDFQVFI